MKKIFLIPLVILVVSALVFGGCAQPAPTPAPAPAPAPTPAPAPAPAPIKLVIASFEPPPGTGMEPLRNWLQELSDRTGGRVTGEIAYGAAMGKPQEHYDLAVKGIAHVSYFPVPYNPGRFPMVEAMQLPVTGEISSETFGKSYWELYKKGYFDHAFREVKVLYLMGMCPYDLQMAKGEDILTFDDIKGKKIRASGAMHSEIIKIFGAAPVGLPAPEIPLAMEKGVIDGQFQHWGFIKSFRSEGVTGSVTAIGVSSLMFVVSMNKATWEKLPADIKAIVDEISPKYGPITSRAHDEFAEDSKELLAEVGGVVHQLSAAELDKIGEAVAPMWEKWIADMEAEGRPGRQLVDDWYNILKGMGVEKPFHGYKPAS